MLETTPKFNEEKAASPSVPSAPLPTYPINQLPHVVYGGNPNYPMVYTPEVVFIQPMDPNVQRIHEYLPWSIINICLGGIILGAIAIVLSLQTRSRKRSNDAQSARRWSRATLIFNLCVTLMSIGIIIFIIVWFAVAVNRLKKNTYPYY